MKTSTKIWMCLGGMLKGRTKKNGRSHEMNKKPAHFRLLF